MSTKSMKKAIQTMAEYVPEGQKLVFRTSVNSYRYRSIVILIENNGGTANICINHGEQYVDEAEHSTESAYSYYGEARGTATGYSIKFQLFRLFTFEGQIFCHTHEYRVTESGNKMTNVVVVSEEKKLVTNPQFLVEITQNMFLHKKFDLDEIVNEVNPYALKTAEKFDGMYKLRAKAVFALYPGLEILYNIGFYAVEDMIKPEGYQTRYSYSESYKFFDWKGYKSTYELQRKTRWGGDAKHSWMFMLSSGTKPTEILGIPNKTYLGLLKNVRTPEDFVIYLNFARRGTPLNELENMYSLRLTSSQMVIVLELLNAVSNGKNVFSNFDQLSNYLRKLDMYQGIRVNDALLITRDYLNMAKELGITPRLDTYSIKVQHDLAMRQKEFVADEMMSKNIKKVADAIECVGGEFEEFVFRPLRSVADFKDEGEQMQHCVARVYTSRMADGESWIFVMRYKDTPDKSYVTIEVSPRTLGIVQKYLSHDRYIEDAHTLDVIRKWHQNLLKKLQG